MFKYKNYYFCNLDFGVQLTGVERAALKRARLFKNYFGVSPIFLTSRFNINLEDNVNKLKEIGWMPYSCDVFNVYEYLRGAYLNAIKIDLNHGLDQKNYDVEDIEANAAHQRFVSKVNKQFYKYVVWKDEQKKQLVFINNIFNNKVIKREKFDNQGRLFAIQELDEKGRVLIEDLIHLDGHLALQRYFDETNKLLKIVVYNKDGSIQDVFLNEAELVDYWLNEIIDEESPNFFVIDRNPAWNIALKNFHKQTGHLTVSIMHSSHLVEMEDNILSGRLNSNFKPVLEDEFKIDHIITLTDHQKEDILKRFQNKDNIVTIPHTIDILPPKPDFSARNKKKLVALSRLAPEKQILDMVLMMNELVRTHPEVQLYIYGDGGEKTKIIEKINELSLNEHVILHGYTDDIAVAYQDAVFSLLTSRCEGFSLAILESLSYGVPAISYDVPYGPASMIQNEKNGFLIPHRDYKMMANKIRSVIDDQERLQAMSDCAYESVDHFTEDSVSKRWKNILLDA
ncbi:glycosyltransferase [Acinetobacter sp. MB5]|uniref:glycosyltransferase n=1 Tax=Acinetobacter sp. MB5 TaxID=2069438 RepID=UPI000DCFBF27|nr:glycosyltransferase [Acinetobacter sp. MB5]